MEETKPLMEQINDVFASLAGMAWGPWLIVLLVGTGLYLTIRFGVIQIRALGHAFAVVSGKYKDAEQEKGEISSFQALMAVLSATVGTGNVVGVAAAMMAGGPGALFWMWVTAAVGMATKFASCTLALRYRKIDEKGEVHAGPMYFIEYGMGPKWKWLAVVFAVFTFCASFGIGNMFQINNVMVNAWAIVHGTEGTPTTGFRLTIGIVFAILTGAVIIGGIKSIGKAASLLVPVMCVLYVGGGLGVILLNLEKVPGALASIFYHAFVTPEGLANEEAFLGGLLGTVIRSGVARGLFSNEAGLGSAPIAFGTAKTKEPVREGLVAMLAPFFDTIVICTITGLAITMTGAHLLEGVQKGEMTNVAFTMGLGSAIGGHIVSLGIVFFAFSTMITWSYYGNRAIEYILGPKAVLPYQIVYLMFIVYGAYTTLDVVINFSDFMNPLMAIPNLIALIVLAPVVSGMAKEYFAKMKAERG